MTLCMCKKKKKMHDIWVNSKRRMTISKLPLQHALEKLDCCAEILIMYCFGIVHSLLKTETNLIMHRDDLVSPISQLSFVRWHTVKTHQPSAADLYNYRGDDKQKLIWNPVLFDLYIDSELVCSSPMIVQNYIQLKMYKLITACKGNIEIR